jgi:hypothetical protein
MVISVGTTQGMRFDRKLSRVNGEGDDGEEEDGWGDEGPGHGHGHGTEDMVMVPVFWCPIDSKPLSRFVHVMVPCPCVALSLSGHTHDNVFPLMVHK